MAPTSGTSTATATSTTGWATEPCSSGTSRGRWRTPYASRRFAALTTAPVTRRKWSGASGSAGWCRALSACASPRRVPRPLTWPCVWRGRSRASGTSYDVPLARERPRQTHGHVSGLGTRRGEAHALSARHQPADPLAPLHFLLVTGAVVSAAKRLLAYGVRHLPRLVPEEQGSVAHPVVDVAVAVDVPLVGAISPRDVERERLHPPIIVSHRVGEEAPGALVQGARGGQGIDVTVLQ